MDFLPKIVYCDQKYLIARKPHGIASSWWEQECFLDKIKKVSSDELLRQDQILRFSQEREFWLLNRLDNATAWLLYFARDDESYHYYHHLQESQKITKIYYAQVYGTPSLTRGIISDPIYHHRQDRTRMTIDPKNGKWNPQNAITKRNYADHHQSPKQEFCRLRIEITSGSRHQIRTHLASIGHPIKNDRLYMPKWLKKHYPDAFLIWSHQIELVSAGVHIPYE